ncbi:uncharacterized protein LOC112510907 [Cynara cardunculus var. scolymus]|uniref:uncharacterized protein LOC112510907 n=1 Tax=Cynara cardunculus var. scolymus TaxID=59895 RepID=UPI000D62C60D|nr:uncharacterized protein LOC112510907 [Cynara cardunculus var. scolymus]
MEVASKPTDSFDFSYSSSSYYTSAPSSPTRLTEFYCGFDELLLSAAAAAGAHRSTSRATVPFAWEEKPGVPKGPTNLFGEDDFSFDVSCELSRDSVPAEDLFQGGVIKPLGRQPEKKVERERGRERFSSSALPSSRSRRTRSLSPLGGSDQRRQQHLTATYMVPPSGSTCATPSVSFLSENGSKKWSFMDLFLFRSASDGRAMDRDPLKKYSAIFRKHDQDIRNSSGSGSMSKRKGRVSAHELHYTVNRAVSNDMKKKTYLPYKQGILGRFSFNP